jgi:hypothetical protein
VLDVLLDELVSDGLVVHQLDVAAETFAKHLVPLPLAEALAFVNFEHLLHLVQLLVVQSGLLVDDCCFCFYFESAEGGVGSLLEENGGHLEVFVDEFCLHFSLVGEQQSLIEELVEF